MWRFLLVISVALVLLLCLSMAGTMALGETLPVNEITFVGRRDARVDVYSIDLRTRLLRNITNDDAVQAALAWSRDGQQLAVVAYQENVAQLYVLDPDGRNKRQLTFSPHGIYDPAWSPDGQRIAYVQHAAANLTENNLYVVEPATREVTPLAVEGGVDEFAPTWSLDGRYIAYFTRTSEITGVVLANADGSNPRIVVRRPCFIWLTWDRDNKLLYCSLRNVLMRFDPSTDTDEVYYEEEFEPLAWSPVRDRILVRQWTENESYAIFEYANRTTHRVNFGGGVHTWSPDGQHIAYSDLRSTNITSGNTLTLQTDSYVFIAPVDGSGREERLLDFPAWNPQWRPVPAR
ncbi:MAG: hypothetical protein SF029_00215 [bacterium]|nr:hypothetical protein [bacterium]